MWDEVPPGEVLGAGTTDTCISTAMGKFSTVAAQHHLRSLSGNLTCKIETSIREYTECGRRRL